MWWADETFDYWGYCSEGSWWSSIHIRKLFRCFATGLYPVSLLDSIFISHARFFKLFFFFFAVASASVDCYSNSLWFLQLRQRGQRIHSAFHQVYTGQSNELFYIWNLVSFLCPNSNCWFNFNPCRTWLFLELCCFSLGWKTPFLEGNQRRLRKQKPIRCSIGGRFFKEISWIVSWFFIVYWLFS